MSYPIPCSSRQRITPSEAARPYALPPDNTTAFSGLSAVMLSVSGVSLDAGPPPLMSQPACAPRLKYNTLAPVFASLSCACPMDTPSISVIAISLINLSIKFPSHPFCSHPKLFGNHCRSACRYHKHSVTCTEHLIIDINAYNRIGPQICRTLFHLLQGVLSRLNKLFLIAS